jgi:hypothetical protein
LGHWLKINIALNPKTAKVQISTRQRSMISYYYPLHPTLVWYPFLLILLLSYSSISLFDTQ